MELHVVHFVRDLDAASGGPSRSVPALAAIQSKMPGLEVSVVFRDRGNERVRLPDSDVLYTPVSGLTASRVKHLCVSNENAIFHLHGLWDPILHRAARLGISEGRPYVVSTRGMLAGWALKHKALKKKIGWALYQRRDLAAARCVVASSPFEESWSDG